MFSDSLLTRLGNASSVAVLTGAGISAESGVPTFRGAEGLWKKFRPEELASVDAFLRNPELVWEWYRHRRTLVGQVSPNAGHYALAEMENLFPDFTLITQNVDDLHRRAGSGRILELHGNIQRSFCMKCGREAEESSTDAAAVLPTCDCGGVIRPGVVWFGETLPAEAIREADRAARRCEIFFSIGTSGEVYPAAQLPGTARMHGAYTVEINPERTSLSHRMDECLAGKSGSILPLLTAEIRRRKT